ncbi:MAG: LuxR family transcriptional regulator [Rhodospirillales bacterium]|nr:LuxR family transcriptional regulator [Rhodospirillales bacterium]
MRQLVIQTFIDRLSASTDYAELRSTFADAAAAFDLHSFAYLSLPRRPNDKPLLISTYPTKWTDHYLESRYERLDPVVLRARHGKEPFEWGLGVAGMRLSKRQQQLFDEAARFDIRCGFTIPVHGSRGPAAAITFASNERHPAFCRGIERHGEALQVMAGLYHAHIRRTFFASRIVDGVSLSPREFECLSWAALGKSAGVTADILGIRRRTAVFHLENAKQKLGVHTILEAVARYSASIRSRP